MIKKNSHEFTTIILICLNKIREFVAENLILTPTATPHFDIVC